MKLGLEALLSDAKKISYLKSKRAGLVAHPASVNHQLHHSVDLLAEAGVPLSCLFGPQHGMRGEKQDNMIESSDYLDPQLQIPVFSLYGKVRRPTPEMLNHFDVLLFDLQDVGCRIYTFLTTLFYLIEDLKDSDKELWILDRPNPAGRPVEGTILKKDFFSFVGGGELPMRHGLTLAEAGQWFREKYGYNTNIKIVPMEDYSLVGEAAQWGWPQDLAWVNPSPNLPTVTGCRVYPGSVLIEGTHLSEARGTTRPLEVIGAPFVSPEKLIQTFTQEFPDWSKGCILRPCYFEPTFHKFKGELCGGVQIHVDNKIYQEDCFQPYRLVAGILRTIHLLYPQFEIFKNPPYEYEEKLLPIEILSGGSELRSWIYGDLETDKYIKMLEIDEKSWREERAQFLLYK
ncbi:MAG: DUF1343 domain-containing protein [Bdellovibrionales bacterium]|nr:DUF1343 domain-containing protein [Bdellovibrionales bacterium]